ncbi:MAG: ATP-dependent DNA ligase [Solirubrobacteraceae bacterium]
MKPMLARLVRELPVDGYLYEPKWDGFRCLAVRVGEHVELTSRHGRPLARYFPELVAAMVQVAPQRWIIDGEVMVVAAGRFDFAALMARLHPAASRIRELAARTLAIFVAFDLVAVGEEDLSEWGFAERRARLEDVLAVAPPPVHLTPTTDDRALAQRWLDEFQGGGIDGVVAKHRDLRYTPGRRAMLKVKHEQTADCVVGGARASADPAEIWSLLLGLYDDTAELEHIGVASSFSRARRRQLVGELAPLAAPLAGHPWEHGFLTGGGAMGRLAGAAGRWTPEMSLDWVPLEPVRVLEASYTQVDGHRLRHPAKFVRWRPDREPGSCRLDQLAPPRIALDVLRA